jgi:hypothetical protein
MIVETAEECTDFFERVVRKGKNDPGVSAGYGVGFEARQARGETRNGKKAPNAGWVWCWRWVLKRPDTPEYVDYGMRSCV